MGWRGKEHWFESQKSPGFSLVQPLNSQVTLSSHWVSSKRGSFFICQSEHQVVWKREEGTRYGKGLPMTVSGMVSIKKIYSQIVCLSFTSL